MEKPINYSTLPCLQGIQPSRASDVDLEFMKRSYKSEEGFEFSLYIDTLLTRAEALRLTEEETGEYIRQAFLKQFYPLLHTPFKRKNWLARLLRKKT